MRLTLKQPGILLARSCALCAFRDSTTPHSALRDGVRGFAQRQTSTQHELEELYAEG
jgi:hypothetical protein